MKWKGILVILLLGTICKISMAGEEKKAPHPSLKLYNKKCKSCHGTDGKGKATMAKPLKIDPALLDLSGSAKKSDEELYELTAKGKDKMPAYEKKLKPEEIDGLVEYMRLLIPKAADEVPNKKMEEEKKADDVPDKKMKEEKKEK